MKNTFFIFLIFGFLLSSSTNAQYPDELAQADSLIKAQDYNNALNVLNQSIQQKATRFVLSHVYFQMGEAYLGLEDFEKATYFNKQSLSIRNDLFYEFIADNYMLFGLIEMQKNNNDKALGYFFKAIDLPYESIEFGGLLYAYIAQVYYRKGETEEVIKYYKVAMGSWMTAFEEVNIKEHDRYHIRRNRLYYDHFFVGYL